MRGDLIMKLYDVRAGERKAMCKSQAAHPGR
jgi:hypothetical protein